MPLKIHDCAPKVRSRLLELTQPRVARKTEQAARLARIVVVVDVQFLGLPANSARAALALEQCAVGLERQAVALEMKAPRCLRVGFLPCLAVGVLRLLIRDDPRAIGRRLLFGVGLVPSTLGGVVLCAIRLSPLLLPRAILLGMLTPKLFGAEPSLFASRVASGMVASGVRRRTTRLAARLEPMLSMCVWREVTERFLLATLAALLGVD